MLSLKKRQRYKKVKKIFFRILNVIFNDLKLSKKNIIVFEIINVLC